MAEFELLSESFPPIPDDLTLAQFILDSQHPSRPAQVHGAPWIIEDHTGVTRGRDEVSLFISCAPFTRGKFGIKCLRAPVGGLVAKKTNCEGWLRSYGKGRPALRTG